jgi:lauroyl/myristoyl acyltransferase
MKTMNQHFREDRCLTFYLEVGLEIAAYAGTRAYGFTSGTSRLFRSFEGFASTLGKRGVLLTARDNLSGAQVVDPGTEEAVLKSYLGFENRFALENIWIRKQARRHIEAAFDKDHVARLKTLLNRHPWIIAIPHMSALYAFVALVQMFEYPAWFVVMDPHAAGLTHPAPFQKSLLRLFEKWRKTGRFVFIQDKNVFPRCRDILNSGGSLIIAPDTPFFSSRNVTVEFMGKKTGIAPGIGALARSCNTGVLAVCPWAENCRQPYRMSVKPILSTDISLIIREVFSFFQDCIRQHPSCWQGWLYWDQMDHKEV